jgi:RHS repeat-associated protein
VSFSVNGLGQRVGKSVSGGTDRRFVYDESGRLIGEYKWALSNSLWNPWPVWREYIWLDDRIVGVIDETGTVNEVYTDHLGTPRAVLSPSGQTLWEWGFDKNAFGDRAADSSPSGGASFEFNLRFPGQYFDAETGLHYNYFRDYEPQTGRYVQSDPIGLVGGLATYQYAYASPLIFQDRFGLDPEMDPFDRLPASPFPVIDFYCRVIGGCNDDEFNDALMDVGQCALGCAIDYLSGELRGIPEGYLASKLSRELARGLGKFTGAYGFAMFYLCLDSCGKDECR